MNAIVFYIVPNVVLHGLPILQNMDGRVLEEALTDSFIRNHEVLIKTVEHSKSLLETNQQSEVEQKEIEQRLRNLRYL